ncbi:MAG: hypothetical protein SPK76_04565 [Bacteroidales bacterium]|nr:hypothetical protein [Bacteroidales bacterium]MDY6444287.1 hypothetical protein [Bacteroidales bacterium]
MVKDKNIEQFFQQHKPELRNSGPFLKEVVRQINAMPIPAAMNPERQKEDCIRLVLEVSRRDLRAVRLAVGVIVAVVVISALTISLLPPDFLPADIFMFK